MTFLKLMQSYLCSRFQRTSVNASFSDWKEIETGFPQGSILGSLLFNIFLNNIFYFINNGNLCNYADDNTLYWKKPKHGQGKSQNKFLNYAKMVL